MSYLLYDYTDYKLAIKDRIKDLKKTKPKFSIQYISEILDIQYTFLSKVLNSEIHHLNEDQVFMAGQTLDFLHDEIEFLMLLRSYGSAKLKNRKNYLLQKILTLQKKNTLSANTPEIKQTQFDDDMKYLMNYFNIVIYVSMWIKDVQKNPHLLCSLLGLDFSQIKDTLLMLDRMGQIKYDVKNNKITEVKDTRTHFGKNHPLTRTHQLVMKTNLNQKSFAASEEKKENLFMTFTTDQEGFKKIKQQIQEFSKQIQQTTFNNSHTGTYQMNIDFLELFNLKN